MNVNQQNIKASCSKNQMGSEETRRSSTQEQLDNMSRSIEGLASRIARLEAIINKQASSDGDDIKAEPHLVCNCSSSKTGKKAKSEKSVKASCSKNQMGSEETRKLSGPDTQVDISTSIERLASRMTSLEATVQTLCTLVKDLKESFPKESFPKESFAKFAVTPYVNTYTGPSMYDEQYNGWGGLMP